LLTWVAPFTQGAREPMGDAVSHAVSIPFDDNHS
jgi:hypothetical protein